MITIALIADHEEVIPTLAEWFRAQWPDYYAGRTQEDVEQDFRQEMNRDCLPLRLVALEDGEMVGTIVLRERGRDTLPEHRPELGGLFVAAPHRGRGVGTELVRCGMETARRLGYTTVYATTVVAAGILERLEWEWVQSVNHHGEHLELYRCILHKDAEAI